MARITEILNVFYSSAGSQGAFDRKAAYDEACERVTLTKNIKFHTIYWKYNIAGGIAMSNAQNAIDQEIYGQYDIYFGCLGPTYGAGTPHEYQQAIEGHIQKHEPKCIFFGFDETPINPFTIDYRSFYLVKRFRNDIAGGKKYGKAILYFTFSSKDEFENHVMLNLSAAADIIHDRVLGGIKFGKHPR
jgi:hypothetical protein